jgi:hypothetical protein
VIMIISGLMMYYALELNTQYQVVPIPLGVHIIAILELNVCNCTVLVVVHNQKKNLQH